MELRGYLDAARRRWLLILGTAGAVVALAVVAATMMTEEYTSTSRVFISTVPTDPNTAYQGGLFSEQRVNSYAELVNSPELSQRVNEELKLKGSAEDLSDRIDASVVPETVVLRIDVADSSAKQAQRINTSVVSQLQRFVQALETPPGKKVPLLKATVVGEPRVPDSPSSPKLVPLIGAALLVGLLLGYGLAVLRELLEAPARRTEDELVHDDAALVGQGP